jgi:hypothetical protein
MHFRYQVSNATFKFVSTNLDFGTAKKTIETIYGYVKRAYRARKTRNLRQNVSCWFNCSQK